MYAYIKGSLVEATPHHVILETQGVGYFLLIPFSLFSKLPPLNTPLLLYTSFIVREDAQVLYGFEVWEEKKLFERLIAISGVGPKMALSLIGHMQACDLHTAIANNQIDRLCRIPGVGKKTAERLIIEMRDKIPTKNISAPSNLSEDATSTLLNLGYNTAQIQKALKNVLSQTDQTPELATLITDVLRVI